MTYLLELVASVAKPATASSSENSSSSSSRSVVAFIQEVLGGVASVLMPGVVSETYVRESAVSMPGQAYLLQSALRSHRLSPQLSFSSYEFSC
jgi:hypothetical protein